MRRIKSRAISATDTSASAGNRRHSISPPAQHTQPVESALDRFLADQLDRGNSQRRFRRYALNARRRFTAPIEDAAKRLRAKRGGVLMTVNLETIAGLSKAERMKAFKLFASEAKRRGIELIFVIDVRDSECFSPLPAHLQGLALVDTLSGIKARRELLDVVALIPALDVARQSIREIDQWRRSRFGQRVDGLHAWSGYLAAKLWNDHGLNTSRLYRTADIGRQGPLADLAKVVCGRRRPLAAPNPTRSNACIT